MLIRPWLCLSVVTLHWLLPGPFNTLIVCALEALLRNMLRLIYMCLHKNSYVKVSAGQDFWLNIWKNFKKSGDGPTYIFFPDHIPVDLRDPFYTDQYEQEHIKPPIIHMLLSGELYCHVYGLILHAEQAASLQSHQSVIQALSRRGIYVLENNTTPVSDLDLSSSPIKMVGTSDHKI